MGLLEQFISNVFDIYPSDTFIQHFLSNNSLDINKILSHDFVKLSLFYSYIWNQVYKTYPTKRDFINYINTLKLVPEACSSNLEPANVKVFVEKTLNTFMHVRMGVLKHLDTNSIYMNVQSYLVDLQTPKFVEEQLRKKWEYRYLCSPVVAPNLLKTFHMMYTSYKAPTIYQYQINPITGNYNEVVIFGESDLIYLTEHEQIQYTIYKDNHMFMKWIDNVGVLFEAKMPKPLLELFIESLGTNKYVNLLNCPYVESHDQCYCFNVAKEIYQLLPAVFSNFIYISSKEYPEMKSLSVNKDHAIYYLTQKVPESNVENNEYLKTYDRYVINSIDNVSKARINKYIVLDPMLPLHNGKKDVVCAPRTYNEFGQAFKDAGFDCCSTEEGCKADFIIDMYNEVDILNYMTHGSVPIVTNTNTMFVRHLITGFVCNKDPVAFLKAQDLNVLLQSIRNNLKYIQVIKDPLLFKYMWKQHLDLSCPVRTINFKNGLLLYTNFVYLYFVKKLEQIVGLEEKKSRSKEYKVVLLDNRASPLSILAILFSLSNLNVMWSCKVYTSSKAKPYYDSVLGNLVDIVHLPALDVRKFHIDVYNDILKSADFWQDIDAVKTLIIQDDGVLLRPGIDKFLEFDYIGASWVDNVANEYIKTHISEELVGNGGFSLRTNSLMIDICKKFEKEKKWLFYKNITHIPEDVYFIYGLKNLGCPVRMPSHSQGGEFASEQICNMNSLGFHKLWSYHIADVSQAYFNAVLKG